MCTTALTNFGIAHRLVVYVHIQSTLQNATHLLENFLLVKNIVCSFNFILQSLRFHV